MSAGYHLTFLGNGKALLEPTATLDPAKPYELMDAVLRRLTEKRISCLYFDLGDIPVIDKVYYDCLNFLAAGCKAVNVRLICFNMQPAAAYALAVAVNEPPHFETCGRMPGTG